MYDANFLISKKFCVNCVRRHYGGEEMLTVLTRQTSWSCPFKMNACCCSKCRCDTNNYKGGDPVQEEEPAEMKQRFLSEERKVVAETTKGVVLEKRK